MHKFLSWELLSFLQGQKNCHRFERRKGSGIFENVLFNTPLQALRRANNETTVTEVSS